MTDRELLEKAAKAMGIALHKRDIDGTPLLLLDSGVAGRGWNPITDDGDALRLAVTLNLTNVFHPGLNQALVRRYNDKTCEWVEDGEKHPDPYSATRRAIVRAAAAIGEQK
ncbi:MAG: hypothetical protein Q7T97_02305 [Burkholderiaceae bacterium]|nr:hypothetical protein [Burkholderiaceae bacterium]